jgi:two-component system CheB/CheR fusion protein
MQVVEQGEMQFRTLLGKLPAGAYTCDPQGLITYFNHHAADLWGREPRLNDPENRYCGSLKLYSVAGTPISHDRCWMALALHENREYNGEEIVIERPDGTLVTALAHANPIRDAHGELLGAVNVLVDITERRASEDALKLEARRKDEFLATLAHELRNPLAPIRNAVEIMKARGTQEPDLVWAREVIDRQLGQLTRLLDDLLDLGRINRDALALRKEALGLVAIVQGAVETARPTLEQFGHELVLDLIDDPIVVRADAVRLTQVFANLLDNAAKYTEPGGRIEVALERRGSWVEVRVTDNGIGIAPPELPHVFDMFTRLDTSRSRKSGGLGVGLSLVKRLVEMHGGTVAAFSEGPAQGSVFTVRLPIALDAGVPANDFDFRALAGEALRTKLRILVVDDRVDTAISFGRLLELLGNQVRLAHNGPDAIVAAEAFRPQVVLLDIGLPFVNGYEVAKNLRARPWAQRPVLIATTGWGQDEDKRLSAEAGFDHHFVKPVDPIALVKLLAKLPQLQ